MFSGSEIYIANNMIPDETAPEGAVSSGFILFASLKNLVWNALEYTCMQLT